MGAAEHNCAAQEPVHALSMDSRVLKQSGADKA